MIVHNAAWITGESDVLLNKMVSAGAAAGWVGVQLFFVLSGLLITGILLDTKDGPDYFRRFYVRRTLRIFPPYYALLVLVLVVLPLVVHDADWLDAYTGRQWPYWLYVSNWFPGIRGLGHLWSLGVEEQFYLVWPLLVWWLSRERLVLLCWLVMAVTPLIRLGLHVTGLPPEAAYAFTIARWDALAAGALLAALLRDADGRDRVTHLRGPVAVVSSLGVVTLVAVQHGLNALELPVEVFGQSLFAALSACLLAYALSERSRLAAHLSISWLRFLGRYSYAMYLFHFPINFALSPAFGPWVRGSDGPARTLRLATYLTVVFSLTILASLASWAWIEEPAMAFREHIAPPDA